MKKGKKCGRAEKWHERRKKNIMKQAEKEFACIGGHSELWRRDERSEYTLNVPADHAQVYSSMPCMSVWDIFICDEHIFFPIQRVLALVSFSSFFSVSIPNISHYCTITAKDRTRTASALNRQEKKTLTTPSSSYNACSSLCCTNDRSTSIFILLLPMENSWQQQVSGQIFPV